MRGMGKIFDFFKCMACGKELNGTGEQKPVVENGMTFIYCEECFEKLGKK